MTELLSDIETPSDAELISCVRGGDVAAYGELFSRHVEAANRLGRQLARGPDADDLVSEAFAKVLQVLQGGGGPDVAFRAYLLTSVRRLHVDRVRAGQKLQTSDDMTQFDPGIPFQDTAVANFENGAAAKAFASLPERWQLVLWHLEVEGQKPADIAPLLGMSANSVSALAYRAREGLRQAFLTMHLADISAEQCRWVNERLGAYVRKGLSRRDTTKVEEHLDECRRCTAMYLELTEVNSNLAGIIAPLLLGAAAAGYLSSTGAASAGGVLALVGRVRDVVAGNATAATAGAVAASVAAVATAGFLFLNPAAEKDVVVSADAPIAANSPNAAPPPELPLGQSLAPDVSDGPEGPDGSDAAGEPPTTRAPAGPGAVVPIGDLATTETPSTVTTDTPSTGPTTVPVPGTPPGADPTTGTPGSPGGPATGGTTDVPTDRPDAPTPPIPPVSTPTLPAPAVPAPSIPDPSLPAPSAPAPSTPGPTVPSPDVDPPPVTTPAEPSLPTADLRLGDVSVDATGTTISIPLTNLPPSVRALTVDLESSQTTFTPETGGDCVIDSSAGNKRAICTPTLFSLGAGEVTARMDAPSEYTIELPLSYPDDMDSDQLTVTVTANDHDETIEGDNSSTFTFTPVRTTPPVPDPDLKFEGLAQVAYNDGDPTRDDYRVRGHVSGVPEEFTELVFRVSEKATFGMATGEGNVTCHYVTDREVKCTDLTGEFDVDFSIFLAEGASESVTITMSGPADYSDPVPTNNSSTVELAPELSPDPDPVPTESLLVAVGAPVNQGANVEVSVTVSGIDPAAGSLYLWLENASWLDDSLMVGVEGCASVDNDGGVQCAVATDGTATLTLQLKQPPGQAADGTHLTLFVSSIAFGAPTAASDEFVVDTSKAIGTPR